MSDTDDEVILAFRFYRSELYDAGCSVWAILAVGAVIANHLSEVESLLAQIVDCLPNPKDHE